MPPPLPPPLAGPNHGQTYQVAIVGAGFAGLQAAATLVKAGIRDIVLLEASPHLGGRVRSLAGFAPWAVEVGAEFVHGGNRSLRRLLARAGCKLTEYAWPDRWFFDGEGAGLVKDRGGSDGGRRLFRCFSRPPTVSTTDPDPDLCRVHALFAGVGKEAYPAPGSDVSARDWLTRTHGATPRQAAIAEACYANDFGADLDGLGLTELITENRRWNAGEAYLVSDRPLADVAAHMAAKLPAQCVRLEWPVSAVEVVSGFCGGDSGAVTTSVCLVGPGGARVTATTAIMAVPLAVLQAGCIAFTPPLPPEKAAGFSRVRVGHAMKIILGFSTRFWPADFFDAVCPGGFVPEFWTVGSAKHAECEAVEGVAHVVTGFLAGRFAREAASLGEAATVRKALAQLDAMFGGGGGERRAPASAAFVRAHVADWAADPHALGAYSFPSRGAVVGDRGALAAPAGGGALLFAGEATHPAVNPCVQAALETGARAGKEAVARVRRLSRRRLSRREATHRG
jgi:monoamine oxidase